jgi:hypothetical protein
MTAPDLQEVLDHLRDYLTGARSLSDFRAWFDPSTWGVVTAPDPILREVVGEIELRLAEFTNGHLSEDDLKRTLQSWVPDSLSFNPPVFVVPVSYGPDAVIFSSEAVPHR